MRAVERDAAEVEQARQSWRAAAAGIAPGRLVFVDESAALTNLARPYGRGPRGERARGAVPCGRWERVTVVGALGAGGVVAAMSVPAATDGAVSRAYLGRVLLPEPRRAKPDAAIVMDNLSAPQDQGRARAAGRLGLRPPLPAALLPRPEPDRDGLGQGEGALAQGRGAHGGRAARRARTRARGAVTARDAAGFFRQAGYGAV